MDPNGNLTVSERNGLCAGERVVYFTERQSHRGERAGRVKRVTGCGSVVWIGWSDYALSTDFVRRDGTQGAAGVAAPKAAQDTPKAPNAPEGHGMASGDVTDPETGMVYAPGVAVEALQARVAALTAERDEARNQLRCLAVLARDMILRVKEVCGE